MRVERARSVSGREDGLPGSDCGHEDGGNERGVAVVCRRLAPVQTGSVEVAHRHPPVDYHRGRIGSPLLLCRGFLKLSILLFPIVYAEFLQGASELQRGRTLTIRHVFRGLTTPSKMLPLLFLGLLPIGFALASLTFVLLLAHLSQLTPIIAVFLGKGSL